MPNALEEQAGEINLIEKSYDTDGEACYIFTPAHVYNDSTSRPPKRRKTKPKTKVTNDVEQPFFVPLLEGNEAPEKVKTRFETYEFYCFEQQRKIEVQIHPSRFDMCTNTLWQAVLQNLNASTVDDIIDFLDVGSRQSCGGRVPTGLITAGTGNTASYSIFESLSERINASANRSLVELSAAQSPNIKAALRNLIRKLTARASGEASEEKADSVDQKYLNYDLQLLHDHVLKNNVSQVVLVMRSIEAFDVTTFSDLVGILCSWLDRIPIILILEIETSIDLFQEKLSRSTIRQLSGTVFEAEALGDALELVFRTATRKVDQSRLWIGASLSKMLLDRQRDYTQSIPAFIDGLKYAHMSHFFANPLSVLLAETKRDCLTERNLQAEHCEAIRNLPSFRSFIGGLLEDSKGYKKARSLLEDDDTLREYVAQESLKHARDSLDNLQTALLVLEKIQTHVQNEKTAWSESYILGMSGNLIKSALLKETLLAIRKLPSDTMLALLETLSSIHLVNISQHIKPLRNLASKHSRPLRSSHENSSSGGHLHTTIIGQKVSLARSNPSTENVSAPEKKYTSLVTSIFDTLVQFFNTYLINPTDIFLHEVLIFDIKAPHRDAFTPKTRFVIERALAAPHDYLGCDCCDNRSRAGDGGRGEISLSGTQPATAILYQLYLESGTLINIADLWAAFGAVIRGSADGGREGGGGGGEGGEAGEEGEAGDIERETLALFYRALAELRYLGLLKDSRRKTDHLTKLAWRGL
ncbi:hypothetical protein MMC09_004101 [Bachmanniomyces sp. S44760]|nr:hypothetical protein [Bachmanniomyces sp. S44760]